MYFFFKQENEKRKDFTHNAQIYGYIRISRKLYTCQ